VAEAESDDAADDAEQTEAEDDDAADETAAEDSESDTPQLVSFSESIAPIFDLGCNFCHHPTNAVKVDLTRPFHPELGIINRPNTWKRSEKKILVVPGDPDASALVWKVEQTELEPKIDGDSMPWHIEPLTAQELENVRIWIADGANDDSFYRSTVARIFGDGVSLGSRGGKCGYCHFTGTDFPPDLVNTFDPEAGVVNVTSYNGEVLVVPGDPEASFLYTKVKDRELPPGFGDFMPLHPDRLTAEEMRLTREWILQGAKDN
jgi:hypothetical protein